MCRQKAPGVAAKLWGCGCLGLFLLFIALIVIGVNAAKHITTGGSVPRSYVGSWQGQDGTTLSIYGNGRGNYKGGGVTVTGGVADLDPKTKTLSIKFFGIGKTLKVDKAPHANGANQEMTLDGTVFRRTQGFTPDTSTGNSSTGNDSDATATDNSASSGMAGDRTSAPSKEEATTLAAQTLLMFNDAVQSKDFTTFRQNASQPFQEQYSESKMRQSFQIFIDQKIDISNIGEMTPQWDFAAFGQFPGRFDLERSLRNAAFPDAFRQFLCQRRRRMEAVFHSRQSQTR